MSSLFLLPAHHGIVLLFRFLHPQLARWLFLWFTHIWCSGLSFINFLVSIAFAITEFQLAVLSPNPDKIV
jgi:hypothetical protein